MKRFDALKVRVVAIDKPNHRQIYVLDHHERDSLIKTLFEMGFQCSHESLATKYAHLPLVVNTNEKKFYTAGSSGMMACAAQSGAIVLNYRAMLDLLIDDQAIGNSRNKTRKI